MGILRRGVRAPKTKMTIMECNSNGHDSVNEKLSKITTLCKENDITVLIELRKRQLGKDVNKTIKVYVVGTCKMLLVRISNLRN